MDSAGTLTAKDTKRILVVDDELSVREILAEGLEEFGFETDMAADADEAMAMLEKEQFHLLLTDIDMPGRSGILRRIAFYPDLSGHHVLCHAGPCVAANDDLRPLVHAGAVIADMTVD